MHELALAQSVVRIVEEEAMRHNAPSIGCVVLEVGALSCVDPHALEFSFASAAEGTRAAGAGLRIETAPGAARCFGCDADVEVHSRLDPCPLCGSHKLMVTSGDEMKVKAVEVN